MDKVIIHYHKQTDTMDIWFGNPTDEYLCEEVGEGVILKKDKNGKVIGIEKLYVTETLSLSIEQPLPVEVVMS